MLKRNQRILIAVSVFVVAVLLFTGLDFLVNSTLYWYNLQYSGDWYWPYTVMYSALYQVVIVCLGLYSRSWRFVVLAEAFCLSGTQDLVYFGLWSGGVFPTGSWEWLVTVQFLGFSEWTTLMQFISSGIALSIGALVAFALPKKVREIKAP